MENMLRQEENELRGIVMSRFNSISSFARALSWDRKKASRIVNDKQRPTANEMEQMAKCLEIQDVYSFVHIFLPSLSTKWQVSEEIPDPLEWQR